MNSPTATTKAGLESGDFRPQAGAGWCEAIIEACWLAALILVPCLCNPFAESGFQPAKIFIFRVLAVVLAAAWFCISFVCPPRPGEWIVRFASVCRRWPLAWALAATAFVYIAANCFSINPNESFWGRYDTRQGTFTFLCGLLFAAGLGAHLRRREQIERLVSAISAGGFVLSLYALFERAGHGALPVPEQDRVFSFLGQPNFFADYLVLIMPITAWRFARLASAIRSKNGNRSFYWAGLTAYAAILLTQLSALYFTGSRAGVLGLAAGIIFVALTISALDQRRTRLLSGLGIVATILVLLAVLNLPNGPLKRWTHTSILTRYTQVFSQREADASFRLNLWKATARILCWKTPLKFPGDRTDQWHLIRPLIGYGPETMGSVLSREFTNPGPNPDLEDRAHNSFWDTWLNLGFLGVAAQFAVLSLAFYQVYRRLGLIFSVRRKWLFFGGLTGLSLGGGLLLVTVSQNIGLAGVGVEFGVASGLMLFPLTAFFLKGDAARQAKISLEKHSLLVYVLAALLSHFVDNTFGFETAATLALGAIFLGAIMASDREESAAEFNSPVSIDGSSDFALLSSTDSTGRSSYVYPIIGTGLILISMLFALLVHYWGRQTGAWETILTALTPFGADPSRGLYTFSFLLLSWLFAAFIFGWEQEFSTGSQNFFKGWLIVLIISGALAVAYAFFQAGMLTRIGPLPDDYATPEEVHHQGLGYLQICLGFIGFCLLCVLVAGFACRVSKPQAHPPANRMGAIISVAAAVAAIWFLSMPFLEAEVLCRWADVLGEVGQWKLAAGLYGRAVDLDPARFNYRELYAQTLQNLAEAIPDPQQYNDLMARAETALLRRPRPGMDSTDLDLGNLYLQWGARQANTNEQIKLGQKARTAFQIAQLFEPLNQLAWRESSIANHLLLHDDETAQSELEQARALTKNQDSQGLGDYFTAKAVSIISPGLRQQYGACALEYFDFALAQAGTNTDGDTLLQLHLKRGYDHLLLGRENDAIQDYSEAAQFTAQPDCWTAEFWLARIYANEGNQDLLDQHLQRALQTAPPDQKQMLLAWRQRLGNQ